MGEPERHGEAERAGASDDWDGVHRTATLTTDRLPPALRLADRTALVTGGASGIGAATCRRLAAEGARVAVTDVNLDGARDVAGEIDGGAYELDVRSLDSIARTVAAVEEELGPVDVLVNNAGYDEWGFFTNTDEALWRRVLEVNLLGVIAVTHAVLPGMQERRRGRIVNVSSEAGRVGSSGSAVYSAAKGGVLGFTKAIAIENGRYGITANAVAPGSDRDPAADGGAGRDGRPRQEARGEHDRLDGAPPPGPAGRGGRGDHLPGQRRRLVRDGRSRSGPAAASARL